MPRRSVTRCTVGAQRHHAGFTEQHVEDRGRGLRVDIAGADVETSERLVTELEADTAVHRGQGCLCRPEVRVVGTDSLAIGGHQPHRSASRTDDRGVVGQSCVGPGSELVDSVGHVELIKRRSDHRDDLRVARRHQFTAGTVRIVSMSS